MPVELPADLRAAIETDACPIPKDSPGDGRTIGELHLRQQTGASVVAVRRGVEVITNPGAEFRFRAGDAAVLLGKGDQTAAATELLHGEG